MKEERLRYLVDEISKMTEEIEKKMNLPDSQILADYDILSSLKFSLLRAIQDSIDACMYLSSLKKFKAPSSYKQCFLNLIKEGLLDEELGNNLSKMASFRNLIIHRYWVVDDSQILEMLRSGGIEDIKKFKDKLIEVLENQ